MVTTRRAAISLRPFAAVLAIVSVATTLGAQQAPPPARTSLGVDAGLVTFGDDTRAWRLGALSLQRKGPAGTWIGRVTVAQRFGITGTQLEADAYPRLSPGTYGYLNAGYSSSTIFPEWRLGGELFTTFPQAWEGSLGVRHLRFTNDPVTLFTGSVGKYVGNYWFSLRPWLRARDGGTATSASVTARRYRETADEYVGARVGYGSTFGDRVTEADLLRQRSVSVGLTSSHRLSDRLLGITSLDFDRETLDAARMRNRMEVNVGLRVDF